MRIIYAITKPTWGGAQAYVAALAEAATKRGHTVSLITGSDTRNTPTLLTDRLGAVGIPSISIPSLGRDIGLAADWRAARELIRTLRTDRPDVLHLNSSKIGLLGALAGRIVGVPRIVFTAHGWPHRESRFFIWKAAAWVGSWKTVLLSHRTIAVSDRDYRSAPSLFLKKKLVRIHNGLGSFDLLPRNEARATLATLAPNLSNFSTWLLMNAELHRNKGIDIAIRALAKLNQNTALIVCGEGEERKRLETLAQECGVSDRVFLLGFIENARKHLRAADLYLMPSRKEGLPIALLEAGEASLPVVAARTGGIPEVVQDGVTGILVPVADQDALAEALTSLLSDPVRSAALGEALYERVSKDFSEANMLDATFAEYSA